MRTNKIRFYFLWTAVISLWLVFPVRPRFLYAEDNGSAVQRITRLEKDVQTVRQNQEKIEAKNNEIKNELANLRIWIHKR